MQYDIMLNVLV